MAAFKDILVIVDTSPSCEARLGLAAALGGRFGAHVTGLFVSPPPVVPAIPDGPAAAALLVQREMQILTETRARAHELFTRHAKAPGMTTEWRVAEGDPGHVATVHARYADLTIVGQVDPEAPTLVPVDAPERIVLGAGRPVLVVPYAGTFKTLGQRALVAWNESREAARAVHDAMPLLEAASKVTALTINARDEGDTPSADLAQHLSRHGVHAEASVMTSDDVGVGALLLSRAADLAADLLVMGAYGHSRLREVVLGGATREIFRSMTVPVLMAH
jgi:nucleotide-binding universal stress UspA family protein